MATAITPDRYIVTESVYDHDMIHEIFSLSVGRFGRPDSLAPLTLPACHTLSDGAGVKIALLSGDVDYLSTVAYSWASQLWEAGTVDGMPTDTHGLGTALLMMMSSDGSGGMPVGIAPGADYRVYPVLGTGGTVVAADAIDAVIRATAWGADVIVIPWTHWVPNRELAQAVADACRVGIMVFCPVPTVEGQRSHETHFDELDDVITVGRATASGVRPPTPTGHGGAVLFGPAAPVIAGGTCYRLVSISGPSVSTCVVAGMYALVLSAVKRAEPPAHHRISAMLQVMLCDTISATGGLRDPGAAGTPEVLPCLRLIGAVDSQADQIAQGLYDKSDLRAEISARTV